MAHSASSVRQLAHTEEAVYVVAHAVWRSRRGRRGRNPSMSYSLVRSRNPRTCLRSALYDLGLESLEEAVQWLASQHIGFRHQDLNIEPAHRRARVQIALENMAHNVALKVDYPLRLQHYFSRLDPADLADVRPLLIGVSDADGRRFPLAIRVLIDPEPQVSERLLVVGRVRLRAGLRVRTLDGKLRALFPNQLVRLRIEPGEGLSQLEFAGIPT